MKYADVDFGNAEEIFVLKGFEPLMAKKVAKAVVKNDREGLAELIENADSGELAAADLPGQKELLAALAGTGDLKSDVAMDNLKDMLEEEIDNNKDKYAMPEKPILRSRASSKKKKSSEILVDPGTTGVGVLPLEAGVRASPLLKKPKKEPPSAFMQSCCCCFLGSGAGQDDEGADDLYKNSPAVQVQGGGGESVQPIGIAKPIHLKIEEAATDSEKEPLMEQNKEESPPMKSDDIDYSEPLQYDGQQALQAEQSALTPEIMQQEAEQAMVAAGFVSNVKMFGSGHL